MWPHTGKYIPHQDECDPTFTYYTFTPCPLRNGRLYKMDDDLTALLADTYQKLGFLGGMAKYAPNKQVFCGLMLLAYSVKIDYKTLSLKKYYTVLEQAKAILRQSKMLYWHVKMQ